MNEFLRRVITSLVLIAVCAGACTDRNASQGASPTRDGDRSTSLTTAPSPGVAPAERGPAPTTPPQPSAGCGAEVPQPGDDDAVARSIASGGLEREYLVSVPDGYSNREPSPMVFQFHGASSNKEAQLLYTGIDDVATTALVVAPDAVGEPSRWSPLQVQGDVDDLAFFEDLFTELRNSWCIDLNRVYTSGASSGGWMATAVTCRFGDVIAAAGIALAIVYAESLCGDAGPVPLVYFHGTDDTTVPFDGRNPNPDGSPSPDGVEPTMAAWATHNGCNPEPTEERIGTDVIHRSWQDCDAPTELYIVEGGGHTWPGAFEVERLGPTTQTISATEIIWEHFSTHP